MMKITIHQTHHTIGDFEGVFNYLKENISQESTGIHLFPELFLTGYPLQDICLQKPFVDKYHHFLEEVKAWSTSAVNDSTCLLIGALEYDRTPSGVPKFIKNVVLQFGDKLNGEVVYTKRLLPNYDIFDEKKYFSKGRESKVLKIFDKNIGILICEDMWSSSFHDFDPVIELKELTTKDKIDLDAIFNLSASPFILNKHQWRIERASEISCYFGCPFYYTNRVGAEDEIMFDGQSFVVNGGEVMAQGKRFQADCLTAELYAPLKESSPIAPEPSLTWEELFRARIDETNKPAILPSWDNDQCQEVLESLGFGIQEYARKNGFNRFTIALSGGMDSALVLTIIKLSLRKDQSLEAIYMPSIHSSSLSYDLSYELCQNLGVPLTTLPIKFLHSAGKNLFTQNFNEDFIGLTDENIQSRLRGLLLYTRSNQIGSMVVNTSNKSELAVGYSTQYGDSVGAISMLGDLYKSEVYRLAKYINDFYKNPIPEQIITREPTAELRPGQADTDSLPPYEILDTILEGILSYRYTQEDLIKIGFSADDVKKVLNLYSVSEYKRYQFCPILKISSKSFGFGYRIPLSKSRSFYYS